MIKVILQAYTYTQRTYNNRYTVVKATNTKTGDSAWFDTGYGDGSNVKHTLRKAGLEWNEIHDCAAADINNEMHKRMSKDCADEREPLKALGMRKPAKK